jgi:MraZ protein
VAVPIDRFLGQHTFSLDNKGRVSIPAEFREVLADRYDDKLVLMKDYDRCLVAYPVEEWQKLDEKIKTLPASDPNVKKYMRVFYSSAKVCQIDGQGRVLIPQELKAYAGLSREVMVVGLSSKMELWDMDAWKRENPEEFHGEIELAMASYGL